MLNFGFLWTPWFLVKSRLLNFWMFIDFVILISNLISHLTIGAITKLLVLNIVKIIVDALTCTMIILQRGLNCIVIIWIMSVFFWHIVISVVQSRRIIIHTHRNCILPRRLEGDLMIWFTVYWDFRQDMFILFSWYIEIFRDLVEKLVHLPWL